MSIIATYRQYGPDIEALVANQVNTTLEHLGQFLVARAQQYAPVRTGHLRESITHRVDATSHVLYVSAPVSYAYYQELGTRHIPPHPYLRPALADAAQIWPISFAALTLYLHPQMAEPIEAHATGFHLPRRQKLTPGQLQHVRGVLGPKSRRLYRRIKRAGTSFSIDTH